MGAKRPSEPTPWCLFGFFLGIQKEARRSQGGEIPLRELLETARRGQAPALRDFSNDARSLKCPLIRLALRPATFPIPSVASRHLPLIRGVGPQGEGLKRAGIKIPMHKKENSPAAQRRTGC